MTKEIIIPWKEAVYTVLVDDDAHALLSRHTWYIMFSGGLPYAFTEIWSRTQGKRMLYMHQIVTGSFATTDHENHNTLDNQFHNLRPATSQQNGWNKCLGRRSKTKYKGVTEYVSKKGETLYRVQIKLSAKGIKPSKWYRKTGFKSLLEAAKDYNREVVIHRGRWAWLNPIPGENTQSIYINDLQNEPSRETVG